MMEEMEDDEVLDQARASLDFAEVSILGTIVPHDPELEIERALQESSLSSIPQRRSLFFGMVWRYLERCYVLLILVLR